MTKKRIVFAVDKDVYDKFRDYCKKEAFKISAKVELLMAEAVKGESVEKASYATLVKLLQGMVKEQEKSPQKKVVKRTIELVPQRVPSKIQAKIPMAKTPQNPKRFVAKKPTPTIDQLRIRKGI